MERHTGVYNGNTPTEIVICQLYIYRKVRYSPHLELERAQIIRALGFGLGSGSCFAKFSLSPSDF